MPLHHQNNERKAMSAQPLRTVQPQPQQQEHQPGDTQSMQPEPQDKMKHYLPAGKLRGKVALVTGGDSGIGRATAIGLAKEGADVAIAYLEEDNDADITRNHIEQEGRRCIGIKGDIGDEGFCQQVVQQVAREFGRLDILINNAAEQHVTASIADITAQQLEKTYRTNLFGMFYLTKAALPHLKEGASIINTASITAYAGSPQLLDYSTTKGAIVAFTRSLSQQLVKQGIRVNAVAPGPIWTPLIPASFSADKVEKFGQSTPMGRPGQPDEVAPAFLFLASDDASYMSGQVLHPNGGEITGS